MPRKPPRSPPRALHTVASLVRHAEQRTVNQETGILAQARAFKAHWEHLQDLITKQTKEREVWLPRRRTPRLTLEQRVRRGERLRDVAHAAKPLGQLRQSLLVMKERQRHALEIIDEDLLTSRQYERGKQTGINRALEGLEHAEELIAKARRELNVVERVYGATMMERSRAHLDNLRDWCRETRRHIGGFKEAVKNRPIHPFLKQVFDEPTVRLRFQEQWLGLYRMYTRTLAGTLSPRGRTAHAAALERLTTPRNFEKFIRLFELMDILEARQRVFPGLQEPKLQAELSDLQRRLLL